MDENELKARLAALREDIANGPEGTPTMTFDEGVMLTLNDFGERIEVLEDTMEAVFEMLKAIHKGLHIEK